MRVIFAAAFFILAIVTARADSCQYLYVQRNSIYKSQGYCFHTQRGIATFGNAGCQYDDVADVPLSVRQRRAVDGIRSEERYQGCSE